MTRALPPPVRGRRSFLSEIAGLARLRGLASDFHPFAQSLLLFCACCLALLPATPALAAEAARAFDVPAGEAAETLKLAARQGGLEIVFFAETVRGVRTPPLRGTIRPREALERLVSGTPLQIVPDEATDTLTVRKRESPTAARLQSTSTSTPTPTSPSVKTSNVFSAIAARFALAMGALLGTQQAVAATTTGSISGRVSNARTGEFLERARVVLEPSGAETFTDAGGYYNFSRVTAGTVQLRAFHTGLPQNTVSLTVSAGQSAHHDFALGTSESGVRAAGETVQLDRFVVASSREIVGAALAINEQRFAPNTRTVVATDELGFVPEGNVAEFMKFLPGITIESSGGFAREVSINGVPPAYVPITVGGFSLASAHPGGGTGRNAALDMISINNLARVDVAFSPTPDVTGAALAGAVNMIPRSSFERSRPVFDISTYVLMRDNARDFKKTPGPRAKATRKVHPGFDFTYIRPVNANFGFTVAAGASKNYLNQDQIINTWRGSGTATNGGTFPHTTPDRPYLSSVQVADNPKDSTRYSFGLTVDYRFTPADRLAFSFQYTSTSFANMSRSLVFNVNRVAPGDFGLDFTRGFAGAGSVQSTNIGQTRDNRTYMPTLTWYHNGPVWKTEAGLGHSHARAILRGFDRGAFNTVTAQRTNVTVSFADIFYLRPNRITVTDGTTGAPVDPYRLDTYVVSSTVGNYVRNADQQRTAYANAQRTLEARIPLTIKTGLDVRQSERDLRGRNQPFSFVGADGRTSTTIAGSDDGAARFLDADFSTRYAPYGFPQVQWMSNESVWQFHKQTPAHFVADENADYRSMVSGSKFIQETVSSAYLRGDVQLLKHRLRLVGGLRAEQTNVDGEGPRTDPTLNFRRDARGVVIRDAAGRPQQITTVPLEVSKLTFLDRGTHAEKEYLRLFPSLNASWSARENLIVRAAVYQSVGRPDLNQYAGGITLPDTENLPSSTNRISVNNAGIKAWSARTINLRVEHYFEGVGQVSIGAFRRHFKNFFASTVTAATPEFLDLYGLDAATYGNYEVATQGNLTEGVRMEGVDFSYKQALTFLPAWARGVQVFANASAQRALGDSRGNFAGYIPRSGSWGISLSRERFNFRANWSYRSRQRRNAVAVTTGVEPGTYNWGSGRLTLDLGGEYYFMRRIAVFANLRNLTDATDDMEIAGPSTPSVAQFRSRLDNGSLWTFGVKGTF